MSANAPKNLKANLVTRQLTSISEKELPCLGKNKMCNKENTAPSMTPGAQLTNKAAITLVTLSFLVLNLPAKLPWDERGRFPTLKAMNSPALLPLAELHTLKAQNIIQREYCKKLVLQLKGSIEKHSPKSSLKWILRQSSLQKVLRKGLLIYIFSHPARWYIIICHLHSTLLHAKTIFIITILELLITITEYDRLKFIFLFLGI